RNPAPPVISNRLPASCASSSRRAPLMYARSSATTRPAGVPAAPTLRSGPRVGLRMHGLGEMRGLLGAQPVGEASLGEHHVLVRNGLVPRHVPHQPASL